jgi:transforming growth factor-beta-induced protein
MSHRETPNGPLNLLDSASAVGGFQHFLIAVRASGFDALLRQNGPFTIFAPTDRAFDKLTGAARADLFADGRRANLADTVSSHIVQGRYGSDEIGQWRSARTVNGRRAAIVCTGDRLSVDGARFTVADVGASNGVLHGIDTVLGGVDPASDDASRKARARRDACQTSAPPC